MVRCPVGVAIPAAHAGTGVILPQTPPDTSAAALRHAVQVPDTADSLPCPVSAQRVRWLRKLVAGLAAAGGM
jgi:hypothetical protein